MTRRSAIYNYAAALSQQCSDEYDLYLMAYQEQAEEACRGRLLNKRGMAQGVKGEQLLRGPGHHMKRQAYASREFQDFQVAQPLLCRSLYETQWLASHLGRETKA